MSSDEYSYEQKSNPIEKAGRGIIYGFGALVAGELMYLGSRMAVKDIKFTKNKILELFKGGKKNGKKRKRK